MEDLKKRKLDEAGNAQFSSSEEQLRPLLEPLAKTQLVDLLAKLYVSIISSFFLLFNPLFFSFRFCYGSSLLGLVSIVHVTSYML